MNARVLFVDDEVNVLKSLRRLFMDQDMEVLTAGNAADAIGMLKKGPISVVVSDNMMPGMNGIDFLQEARNLSPDSIRIMLTGYADIHSAIDAINKGEVYRFVTKPWDDQELTKTILGAIAKHAMTSSLKKADEATLLSLAQTIELKDLYTRGHCERVGQYAQQIARSMGIGEEQQIQIRYGGWLHDCGKIGVPEAILNYDGPLSPEQMDVVKHHPVWGADVARCADLSETIVNIILYHHERYDGKGYPSGLDGLAIPVEARIVAVADTYDALASDRPYRKRMAHEQAVQTLEGLRSTLLDPEILDILLASFKEVR